MLEATKQPDFSPEGWQKPSKSKQATSAMEPPAPPSRRHAWATSGDEACIAKQCRNAGECKFGVGLHWLMCAAPIRPVSPEHHRSTIYPPRQPGTSPQHHAYALRAAVDRRLRIAERERGTSLCHPPQLRGIGFRLVGDRRIGSGNLGHLLLGICFVASWRSFCASGSVRWSLGRPPGLLVQGASLVMNRRFV